MKKYVLYLPIACLLMLFSCAEEESKTVSAEFDLEFYASEIVSTETFIELSTNMKEQHLIFLADLRNGAVALDRQDVDELSNSLVPAKLLADMGYEHAERLAEIGDHLKGLHKIMDQKWEALKMKIGEQNVDQVVHIVNTKYKYMYSVSAEEALANLDINTSAND